MTELNIVFVGHIDAGKSSICGHLLKKLAYIDDRDFEKTTNDAIQNGMERWKYAYILDILEEERIHGKTKDYISIPFDISKDRFQEKGIQMPLWLDDPEYLGRKINFIDTPGHKQLVKCMIEGAYLADVALLICSVKKGEFESGMNGQTKEHLYLLRGLGVKQLIVVYNKMDTIGWDRVELTKYEKELNNFLKKIKFPDMRTVAISGWEGTNLVEEHAGWGPNLLKVVLESKKRETEKVIKVKPTAIKCQVLFLDGNYGLVTKGFQVILHNGNKYFDAEVEDIEGKMFVRKGEQAMITLSIASEEKLIDFIKNVVLRKEDLTIAIGIIC